MKTRKRKLRIWHFLVLLLLLILSTIAMDYRRNSKVETIPERPGHEIKLEQDQIYYELTKDAANMDWSRLAGTLEYIQSEYDCSDFRLVNLVRILYDFGDRIPETTRREIEEVLFNFRYWWDEPGENSMCYWSENHQILFASAEYLIGQLYPDQIFPSSGLSGKEHMEKARVRALDWLKMRWDYGFIEYYSSVYYKEDIGALINLIDFAADKELVNKSKIVMDLLFYDVAAQSLQRQFSSVSGRAYQRNRMGREAAEFSGLMDYLWGSGEEIGPHMMYGMMRSERYEVPPVFREIALDSSTVIIKQSNGLDLSELTSEGYYGSDNRSMMMQWGMEAFTNPEVVRNSLAHIRNCNMFSNESLGDFKILNYRLLHWLHLEPTVVRIINPQTNGVAIQKGETYTYRTKDYSMYTVQAHQVGDYGDQQHVFGINMAGHFSVFHNHPALEKDVDRQSPNYWVGYGHFPHSMQDGNVNLSIYNLPKKKGMMESDLLDYTRAYFPSADFDTTIIDGSYVFGKLGEAYCALIGANEFRYRDEARDDIIQDGKQSFWIAEAGSASEDGSFAAFVSRIRENPVHFDEESLVLSYESNQTPFELEYGAAFKVNGRDVDTEYPRYDSPYVQGEKKDPTFRFEFKGQGLFLDFENQIRKIY
jgi:hypothetical protein